MRCRGCYLLFTDSHAQLRYRAVPDRYLAFPDFALDRRAWEALQIPVGLAFFFRNSALDRTVAFYPGPAGATESELDLDAWNAITRADPRVGVLADDVEALLVRVPDDETASRRSAIWSRSTPATNSSADCGCCGGVSTAGRRRAGSSTNSSARSPTAQQDGGGGDTPMSDVTFAVLDVAPEPYAVTPVLTARRRRRRESADDPVHAIALRCQVRIEPLRRGYTDDEADGLTDLFGPRERWATTQRTFLWQHSTAMVQGFSGSHPGRPAPGVHLRLRGHCGQVSARLARRHGAAAIPVQRNDFHQGTSGLLRAAGAVGPRGPLRHAGVGVARPDRSSTIPNTGWVRLDHDTVDALGRLQVGARPVEPRRRGHLAAGRTGVQRGGAMTASWGRARAVADAVLYEGYLLYPYRATSSKNQSRWQFGVLGPPGAADAGIGEDDTMSTQFLVQPGAGAELTLVVRFLHLQRRRAERELGGQNYQPVDELPRRPVRG